MTGPEAEAERRMAGVLADFLDQGRLIDGLSKLVTAASLIALLLLPLTTGISLGMPTATAFVVAVIGLAETRLAFRVSFDAALFRALAIQPDSDDLAGLDAALQGLGLLPEAKAGRPFGARATGARSLLYTQATMLAMQAVLILAGAGVAAAGGGK